MICALYHITGIKLVTYCEFFFGFTTTLQLWVNKSDINVEEDKVLQPELYPTIMKQIFLVVLHCLTYLVFVCVNCVDPETIREEGQVSIHGTELW